MFAMETGHLPEFSIEIYTIASDASEWLLQRTTLLALSRQKARKEASRMFASRRKAANVRVLNDQGQVVYEFNKQSLATLLQVIVATCPASSSEGGSWLHH